MRAGKRCAGPPAKRQKLTKKHSPSWWLVGWGGGGWVVGGWWLVGWLGQKDWFRLLLLPLLLLPVNPLTGIETNRITVYLFAMGFVFVFGWLQGCLGLLAGSLGAWLVGGGLQACRQVGRERATRQPALPPPSSLPPPSPLPLSLLPPTLLSPSKRTCPCPGPRPALWPGSRCYF